MTIGTPGNYNLNHIFASMTARAAGVDYVNVPYTGGSKVVADLIGRHVDLRRAQAVGNARARSRKACSSRSASSPMSGWRCFQMCRPSRNRGHRRVPYGPVVQMAYVVGAGATCPPMSATKLITAFRAAIQDPRFKEFSKKNAFLVDDLTGDAPDQEVDSVAAALGTVAAQVFPKDQKR